MAQKHFDARIQWKRDTSSNWTSSNPVLLNGEIIIVDTDNGDIRFKIGDGVKTYTQLPFEDEVIRNLINTKADKTIVDELSTGVVYHNQQQSLTEEQKLQAKKNIGAEDEVYILQEAETLDNVPEYIEVVYDSNEETLGLDVGQFATKEFIIEIFEKLKTLILTGESDEAVAVLDEAILDLSILA